MSKIRVENIVKTFNRHSRNANKVLKGVSFDLPDKGLVCIFGKSGSGKTTLLNIIGGLEKADSGKVYIDGECTGGKTDRIRNAKIGFIFQNYYLEKGYTIAEILRNQMMIAGFKDEKEIERRTEEVLKLVDMERFKNKLGDALSGGQQQRVAIARAIVKGSDVILADEPTGNLDAENTMKVMDILKEISRTQLVVIVTHEVSLIKKYADSHIKIVDGELVEDGEIEETDLAPATYDNVKEGNETHSVLTTFTKSTAKRNGRLFTKMGEMGMFSGLLYCAECGGKMYQCRATNFAENQKYFICSTYRKGKDLCTTHSIKNVVLHEIVLRNLREAISYVSEHEAEFIQDAAESDMRDRDAEFVRKRETLAKADTRIAELDRIISRLYEDNVIGKLSDERFIKMSHDYELEQSNLKSMADVLRKDLKQQEQQKTNVKAFIAAVKKYTDLQELDAAVLRAFIDRIEVSHVDKKSRTREITIVYNFIGAFDFTRAIENARNTSKKEQRTA